MKNGHPAKRNDRVGSGLKGETTNPQLSQEELYRIQKEITRLRDKAFGWSHQYLKSKEDREDVIAIAQRKALTKAHTWSRKGELGAWYRRIVINCCRDMKRKKTVTTFALEEYDLHQEHQEMSDLDVARIQICGLVKEGILTRRHLRIFDLMREGYTVPEISDALGLNKEKVLLGWGLALTELRRQNGVRCKHPKRAPKATPKQIRKLVLRIRQYPQTKNRRLHMSTAKIYNGVLQQNVGSTAGLVISLLCDRALKGGKGREANISSASDIAETLSLEEKEVVEALDSLSARGFVPEPSQVAGEPTIASYSQIPEFAIVFPAVHLASIADSTGQGKLSFGDPVNEPKGTKAHEEMLVNNEGEGVVAQIWQMQATGEFALFITREGKTVMDGVKYGDGSYSACEKAMFEYLEEQSCLFWLKRQEGESIALEPETYELVKSQLEADEALTHDLVVARGSFTVEWQEDHPLVTYTKATEGNGLAWPGLDDPFEEGA